MIGSVMNKIQIIYSFHLGVLGYYNNLHKVDFFFHLKQNDFSHKHQKKTKLLILKFSS
jgi:hypothetical protein